uniref:procollagen-proline 4-dioxygenase n=1 Tax=Ciona savignyi TaxID=51511 RepID=H2YXY8_CIOSA
MYLKLLCVLSVLLISSIKVQAEWFSSMEQIIDLVRHESLLAPTLQNYIKAKMEILLKLKTYGDELSEIADKVSANKEEYIIHPINQYHLIKRFATQWTEVNQLLDRFNRTGKKTDFIKNATRLFPKEEDIKGSAEGILRIQDTYNLNTSDIAEGNISGEKGHNSLKKLTTDECYHIGKAAFNGGLYDPCTHWMQFSLQRFEEGKQNFSKAHAEEYLQFEVYDDAYNKTDPLDLRSRANLIFFRRGAIVATKAQISSDDKSYKFSANSKFPKVCRGDVKIVSKTQSQMVLCIGETRAIHIGATIKLHCYLHTNNGNPWLMFNPVKVEELWDSPHIVQFYDVITSAEVDKIKKLAKPRLFRAIHFEDKEDSEVFQKAAYRITKVSWLNDTSGPVIAKLTRRISEITGLSMNTTEELQVANYGVGGEYPPHLDVASDDHRKRMYDHPDGERIATFLIYLSEVEEGGGTAFVRAGVAAKPIKGSAVFWYNMYPSGDIDIRTFHGACPVIIGNKWASNKWIRELGESFHRQCKLDRNA